MYDFNEVEQFEECRNELGSIYFLDEIIFNTSCCTIQYTSYRLPIKSPTLLSCNLQIGPLRCCLLVVIKQISGYPITQVRSKQIHLLVNITSEVFKLRAKLSIASNRSLTRINDWTEYLDILIIICPLTCCGNCLPFIFFSPLISLLLLLF